MNASAVSDTEEREFLEERQRLLDKEFDGTISRREANRLTYINWTLDRITDARHGAELDELEAQISRYERFAEDVRGLREDLGRQVHRRHGIERR